MSRAIHQRGFSTLDREGQGVGLFVQGVIPSWLGGSLLRTGPAKFEVGKYRYNHWFDGLAMVHRFGFSEGRVNYSNRYLRSDAYCQAMATGEIRHSEFATNPRSNLVQRLRGLFGSRLTDNCDVSVGEIAGCAVSYTETRHPLKFDAQTLETLGHYDYDEAPGDSLPGTVSTAHPKYDAGRNCWYNYMIDFGRESRYCIFRIDNATAEQKLLATIPVKSPAYIHSFGMSERFLILVEYPLVVNPLRLRFSGEPFIRNYRWKPEKGTHFHVIEKGTGRLVKSATSDAFFSFHHVNAFEQGQQVCIDLIVYPNNQVIDELFLDRLRNEDPVQMTGTLARFCLNLQAPGEVDALAQRVLSDEAIEFPQINPSYSSRTYSYVYGTGLEKKDGFNDSLVKIDVGTGEAKIWHQPDCYPGEPIFVPTPDAEREDDGVLLSVVLDAHANRSFLLCLNAASMQELGRAQVRHHIPFGLHGTYFSDKQH